MERFISLFGLLLMLFIAYLCSENKRKSIGEQLFQVFYFKPYFALIILKTSVGHQVFEGAREFFAGS